MATVRKYSKDLIDIILEESKNGATVKELSSKYSVDRRRISEWLNSKRNFIEVSKKNTVKISEEKDKTVTTTSKEFFTVEEVLIKNGISQDEWEVSNVYINNWDDASGKANYQTKVQLTKKTLNLRYQIPAPIEIKISNNIPKKSKAKSNIKCALILPDMQVGFRRNLDTGELVAIHDREAMNIALQIAEYLSPDRIVLLGDNLDLAEFSTKYSTPPDMYFTTQASIVELSWWLGQLRNIGENIKIDYIGGNHCSRYNRLIESKAIALSGLKAANNLKGAPVSSIENLLGLDQLNIEYHQYPQGKVALNSNLVCIHGEVAKGSSGATVAELVKSARVSVIQGHIHRHEIATKTTWDAFNNSYQYTAASFGCLCKIDPGFVPGMKYLQNWQNGVGVVWYEDSGLEQFRMEYIPIIRGRALYQTEVFEADSEDSIILNIEKDTRYKVS